MAPEVTYASELVTPEQARKWLKQNKHNRDVKEWRVRLLERDIRDGNFVENGEVGVTFDWNNHIAGGQHTLHAIDRAGKPVRMRVTRGVAPTARDTMNDTLKQRFYDTLTTQGVPHATYAEPMLRKVCVWEAVAAQHKGCGGLSTWRNNHMSRAHLVAEWPRYAAGIIASLTEAQKWYDPWPAEGNRGALQFMHWLLTEKHGMDRATVGRFLDRIAFGSEDPKERQLLLRLRKKFADNHNAEFQVYWMCRFWNHWTEYLVKGKAPSKLQGPRGGITDPYPKLRIVR